MEKEEKGNMNMTVGVVLTVAVAILLLVAMIPAMMPAQEGGDPTESHIAIVEREDSTHYLYYGTFDADGNLTRESVLNFTNGDSMFRRDSGYLWLDSYGLDRQVWGGENTVTVQIRGQDEPIETTTPDELYEQLVSKIPTITSAQLLWDAFTCPNQALPGETPEPPEPSDPGVDTNTVLIGAIISLLFISIALVAVRSFRA